MADTVTFKLNGRIDSNNASAVEEELFSQLREKNADRVILDAHTLEYISSAGLRILLRVKKVYPKLKIINVGTEVYEIFDMTGFTEIMEVEKAYRVVSVEGCEVIGEGANGKVYRIDHDNVVKTYKNADALADIQHEREVARLALISGIPTAISYDVVKVGDSYGSVFELLDAKSFAGIIAGEPERFDWCVKEYTDLLKKLHGTEVPEGKLPRIKAYYQERVRRILPLLPEACGEKLVRLIDEVPERGTMIHGDFHTKNVVLAGDEVLLIDMDTLSVGHPIFEFSQIYNSYVGFGEYDPGIISRFQGFSAQTARVFWRRVLGAYFGTGDEETITRIEDKIRIAAYVRLIEWSSRHHRPDNADDAATRALWMKELLELLGKVDSLDFDVISEKASVSHELETDALVENLPKVAGFIEGILDSVSCPLKVQIQIGVAAEEIFVNIAHYAYAPNVGKAKLRVTLSDAPAAVTLEFSDSGVPYDPLSKPDPDITLSAEERQIGGLGILMTKKTMDEVTYAYRDGRNILTMKKYF